MQEINSGSPLEIYNPLHVLAHRLATALLSPLGSEIDYPDRA